MASIQQQYPRHVACGMMAFIQQDSDTLEPMPGSQGLPGSEPSSQVRRRLQSYLPAAVAAELSSMAEPAAKAKACIRLDLRLYNNSACMHEKQSTI